LFLSMVDRPYDPLAKWDEMIAKHGKLVGIGSSDAHEVRAFGLKFAPYDVMFKLVRTHVLLPHGTPLAEQSLYDNLRRGHAYFSIGLVGDASGFEFLASDNTQVLGVMGDSVTLSPGLQLTTLLPVAADLTLFKDGRAVATQTAQRWSVDIMEPGAYRVEATRRDKPWIFSNPVYVTSPASSESPLNAATAQPAP
jgi:hypothetical protein